MYLTLTFSFNYTLINVNLNAVISHPDDIVKNTHKHDTHKDHEGKRKKVKNETSFGF